jgi:hypothetical protein
MSASGRAQLIALLAVGVCCAGCGKGDDSRPPSVKVDPPARPPHGWRTIANRRAGFTIAAPRRWTARVKDGATLIRSRDRLVVVTIGADRSAPGRELSPSRYARETLQDLPDFEGSVSPRTSHVRGSPYRSAVVRGGGTVSTSHRRQRITVAVLKVRGRATFALVVFRNAHVPGSFAGRTVARMLRSLRAGVPRRYRSGRSG